MGVVIKQSFWGTFIAYTGVIVGYVNTLYFRAEYFTLGQIGLFTLITANAMMVSPVSSFGAGSTYIKFFPSFSEETKHRLFSFLFLTAIIGNALILGIGLLFSDAIASRYAETSPDYIDYLFVTGIIIVSNSLFDIFFSYSRSILKVVVPSFLRDVYLRLGSLLLVIGYAMNWWDFHQAVIGLGIVYFCSFLFLFVNLLINHGFRFDFNLKIIDSTWRKNLIKFGIYSMMLAGSFAVINNISYDQITALLGEEMTGIYTTCFFIGVVVEMPKRNMAKVMMPIISKASKANDQKTIESIYKRSSLTMSVVGLLLAIGILTNLNDLFAFIPKGSSFAQGLWVVVFVCCAKASLMISSFAAEIINYSEKYQYNLYFQIAAAVLLVLLNSFFIPKWGITGAGLSYMISIIAHILIKAFFVKYQFNIIPFTKSHIPLFGISVAIFGMAWWFEPTSQPFINIACRSILTGILFLLLVYRFKISTDINTLINSTFERFLKIKLPK